MDELDIKKIEEVVFSYEKKLKEQGFDSFTELDKTLLRFMSMVLGAAERKSREIIFTNIYNLNKNAIDNATEQSIRNMKKSYMMGIINTTILGLEVGVKEPLLATAAQEAEKQIEAMRDYASIEKFISEALPASKSSKRLFNTLLKSVSESDCMAKELLTDDAKNSFKTGSGYLLVNGNKFDPNTPINENDEITVNRANVDLTLGIIENGKNFDAYKLLRRKTGLSEDRDNNLWLIESGIENFVKLYNTFIKANETLRQKREEEKTIIIPKIKIGKKYKEYKAKKDAINAVINKLSNEIFDCEKLLAQTYLELLTIASLNPKLPDGATSIYDVISDPEKGKQFIAMLNMAKANIPSIRSYEEKEISSMDSLIPSEFKDADFYDVERIVYYHGNDLVSLKEMMKLLQIIDDVQKSKTLAIPISEKALETKVEAQSKINDMYLNNTGSIPPDMPAIVEEIVHETPDEVIKENTQIVEKEVNDLFEKPDIYKTQQINTLIKPKPILIGEINPLKESSPSDELAPEEIDIMKL